MYTCLESCLCDINVVPTVLQVTEDFVPVVSRVKATIAPLGGPKGEISYAREHEAVWFKGKRFTPNLWSGSPGEEQIKQLRHALDSKGKKVGEEWFTTPKVEAALTRYSFLVCSCILLLLLFYFFKLLSFFFLIICVDKFICFRYHEANAKAAERVLEILRELATELHYSINILVFSSTLLVITKALFAHARFVNICNCFCFIFLDRMQWCVSLWSIDFFKQVLLDLFKLQVSVFNLLIKFSFIRKYLMGICLPGHKQ